MNGFLIFVFSTFFLSICADYSFIPVPFWCSDASLMKQAGTEEQCKSYNTSAYGKKIKLTLLYESLCGGCQELIKETIYEGDLWKYGRKLMDLELVPYGNADHTTLPNGSLAISCQHGKEECQLNKIHSCVIHQLVDTSRWFPFIYCMEGKAGQKVDPTEVLKQCYDQQKVKASEQSKIEQCVNGPLGDQLQKAAAERTDSVKPQKHGFVPWILINDISLQEAQLYQPILFGALCDWTRGIHVPDCEDMRRSQNTCANSRSD